MLVQEIETRGSCVEGAIQCVVNNIKSTYKYSFLTFLLSDVAKLYAYRDFAQAKDEEYYGLMYAKEDELVLFSQEPIWSKDWVIVSNRCLVVVNGDLGIKCIELS